MWFFTAIIAKIASAGAVAQAATGAGIVLVGFTGAGAAGALPDPVQHTFTTVVATITPVTAPEGTGGTTTTTTAPVTTTTAPVTTTAPATPTTGSTTSTTGSADRTGTTDGTAVSDPTTTSAPKNSGRKVSEDAKDGGVDGRQVSRRAHERNDARKKKGSDTTIAPVTRAPETDDDSGS
jgi:hypothetical protein